MSAIGTELGLSVEQAWLVVITATGVYLTMVVLSRLFGQRHFMQASSYDLAFVFALGSLVGRVILIRTTLLAAVLGLLTIFALHAAAQWLHHHSAVLHRLMQNPPILLAAHGDVLEGNLRRAKTSHLELYRLLRSHGYASLDGVAAAILEPSGSLSVIADQRPLDAEVLQEVDGAARLYGNH